MSGALVALIDKADVWVINSLAIAASALIVSWLFYALLRLRKNNIPEDMVYKFASLQEAHNELRRDYDNLTRRYGQAAVVTRSIKKTQIEVNGLFYLFINFANIEGHAYDILTLIVNRVSMDLKYFPDELHRCAIWLDNNEGQLVPYAVSSGFPEYYQKYRTLEVGKTVAGRCCRIRKPVYAAIAKNEGDYEPNPDSRHNYNSLICVPMMLGNDCFGVMTVDGRNENAFTEEDVETVEAYAGMATTAMAVEALYGVIKREGCNG